MKPQMEAVSMSWHCAPAQKVTLCWNPVLIEGPYLAPTQLEEARLVITLTTVSSLGFHKKEELREPGTRTRPDQLHPTAPCQYIHTKENRSVLSCGNQAYVCLPTICKGTCTLVFLYPPLSYTLDQSLFSIPLTHLINRDFGFTPLLISLGVLAGIETGMTGLAISVDKAELKTYAAVSKKT